MATWYASSAVSGTSGNGSLATPWGIAHAASGAAGAIHPGDTLRVKAPVTARFTGPLSFTMSGTASQRITIRPWDGEHFIVRTSWPLGNTTGIRLAGNYLILRSNDVPWVDGMILSESNPSGGQRFGDTPGEGAGPAGYGVTGDFSECWGVFTHNVDAGFGALQAGSGATYLRAIGWCLGRDFAIGPGDSGAENSGDYPFYVQNPSGVGDKVIEQCVTDYFQGRYHTHLYGSSAEVANVKFRKNCFTGKGSGHHIGSYSKPATAFEWSGNWAEDRLFFGYGGGGGNGLIARNFHWKREWPGPTPVWTFRSTWSNLTVEDNVLFSDGSYDYERTPNPNDERLVESAGLWGTGVAFRDNRYYSRNPSPFRSSGANIALAAWKAARADEGGDVGSTFTEDGAPPDVVEILAHPTFPNWWIVRIRNFTARANTKAVDVSSVLDPGDGYQVYPCQDPLPAALGGTGPLHSGTLAGSTITFTLNHGRLEVPLDYGNAARDVTAHPKELQFFHLIRTEATSSPPPEPPPSGTSAEVRDVSSSPSTTGSTHTVAAPETVNGDVLLAELWADDGTFAQTGLPAGFTQIASHDGGASTGVHFRLGWKLASGEGASYAFTRGNGNGAFMVCRVTSIANVDSGGPTVTPTPVSTTPGGSTVAAPGLTPSSAAGLFLTFVGGVQADADGATTTFSPPTGMNELDDRQSGVYMAAASASLAVTSASPIASKSASVAGGALTSGYRVGASTFIPAATVVVTTQPPRVAKRLRRTLSLVSR